MPTYDFINEKTGEVFTEMMSIADKEKFLKKNKHIKQAVSDLYIGDSVRLGVTRPPADFQKYVLGKVQEKVGKKYATGMNKRYQIPKEI